MKKIIYGESNFRKVKIDNNYLYVDKTQYIEELENINESFLIFYALDALENLFFFRPYSITMTKIQPMSLMPSFKRPTLEQIQRL